MRKPAFSICENKVADQLRDNHEADQRLCFRYKDSTIPLLSNYEISSLCGCRAWFVWDLVENPEDWFSHDEAHMAPGYMTELFDKVSGTHCKNLRSADNDLLKIPYSGTCHFD